MSKCEINNYSQKKSANDNCYQRLLLIKIFFISNVLQCRSKILIVKNVD